MVVGVIIGGSVAGLCCALSLHKIGIEVIVLEKEKKVRQAGAGIGLDLLSQKILSSWGFPLDSLSLPLYCEEVRTHDGKILHQDHHYGFRSAHWRDLYNWLVNTIPEGIVRYGVKVENVILDSDFGCKIEIQTETNREFITGDFLLACDGASSPLRSSILSPSPSQTLSTSPPPTLSTSPPPLSYRGYVAWRGVVDVAALSSQEKKEIFDFYPDLGKTLYFELSQNLSQNGHTVVYLIPNTTTTTENNTNNNNNNTTTNNNNSGVQINWLWYLPSPPPSKNSFTSAPPASYLPPLLSQASSSFSPAFVSLVRSTSSPFLNHIFDLSSPLSSLLSPSGRGGMVGDAAHPTSPHYLKATNMSILDAFILSQTFSSVFSLSPSSSVGEKITTALKEYERQRLPTTTSQMLFARYLGKLKQGMIPPFSFSSFSPSEERSHLGQNFYLQFCQENLQAPRSSL